ncbi:hypothetical protein ACFY36_38905 [Actinoplanes sp. NPDC000266]
MRKRRSSETDLAAGDPGLRRLIEAARAPATASELSGEKHLVDAFTAERKRAARAARRRRPARIRAVLVPATAGLALLLLTGTAVAARTGNLPQEAQQHAHRLFSALGVPAPRTGTPSPRVTPSESGPAPSRPGPGPSVDVAAFTRCEAWRGAAPLTTHDRRRLIAEAGSERAIDNYCRKVRQSASPAPPSGPPTPPAPSGNPSAHPTPPSADLPGRSASPSGGPPYNSTEHPENRRTGSPPSGVTPPPAKTPKADKKAPPSATAPR